MPALLISTWVHLRDYGESHLQVLDRLLHVLWGFVWLSMDLFCALLRHFCCFIPQMLWSREFSIDRSTMFSKTSSKSRTLPKLRRRHGLKGFGGGAIWSNEVNIWLKECWRKDVTNRISVRKKDIEKLDAIGLLFIAVLYVLCLLILLVRMRAELPAAHLDEISPGVVPSYSFKPVASCGCSWFDNLLLVLSSSH